MKNKKKKSENTVTMHAKKMFFDNENFTMGLLPEGTVLGTNGRLGKHIGKDDMIVHSQKSIISHVGVSPQGKPFVMIHTTPDELYQFAKKVKKDEKYFLKMAREHNHDPSYLKHLNAEVTFCVKPPYKAPKKKKSC